MHTHVWHTLSNKKRLISLKHCRSIYYGLTSSNVFCIDQLWWSIFGSYCACIFHKLFYLKIGPFSVSQYTDGEKSLKNSILTCFLCCVCSQCIRGPQRPGHEQLWPLFTSVWIPLQQVVMLRARPNIILSVEQDVKSQLWICLCVSNKTLVLQLSVTVIIFSSRSYNIQWFSNYHLWRMINCHLRGLLGSGSKPVNIC